MSTLDSRALHARTTLQEAQARSDRMRRGAARDRTWLRMAKRYAVAALGCLAFALIYAQFSHGVRSAFMSWMFAIPLGAGALPACAAHILGAPKPTGAPRQLWALALAAFTLASCLRGIFEIAGTGSAWLWAYVIAGICLAVASLVSACFKRS